MTLRFNIPGFLAEPSTFSPGNLPELRVLIATEMQTHYIVFTDLAFLKGVGGRGVSL